MRAACLAFLLAASAAAQAQEGLVLGATAGLAHRELRERAASGNPLLTERGLLPGVQVHATRTWASGMALEGEAGVASGRLEYDGQTQGGTPLQTKSHHTEWTADARWRPFAPTSWGEGWLTLGLLSNRRDIAGTPSAGGLREKSDAVMAGVRWATPAVAVPGEWQARGIVDARWSAWHHLDVDYMGLLDASSLRGARKQQAMLHLVGQRAGSPWSWDLGWSRLSQPQSEVVPVYRNGVLFGTVRQPALRIEDLGLSLTRRF